MIRLFDTDLPKWAEYYVSATVKNGMLSEGSVVVNFEQRLEKVLRLKNLFTVNSGTSALHLALLLANVKPGDEVILPAQTFVATGLAVLYCGAKPVFADINTYDGNINVDSVLEKITEKTKAVIAVDWAGYPSWTGLLQAICDYNGVKLIIDAAHSLGAIIDNKYVGAQADFTCFSFQAIKTLTAGDGGAVVCKDVRDYERGKKLRWFGIDRVKDLPDESGERLYNLKEVGYKYHMNNVSASLGLSQLNGLSIPLFENLYKRKRNAEQYDKLLPTSVIKMGYKPHNISAYWLYPILVDRRNDFIRRLKEEYIETSVVHLGIDRNSIFGGLDNSLENQRFFDKHQVNIPVHSKLNYDDIERIVGVIESGW